MWTREWTPQLQHQFFVIFTERILNSEPRVASLDASYKFSMSCSPRLPHFPHWPCLRHLPVQTHQFPVERIIRFEEDMVHQGLTPGPLLEPRFAPKQNPRIISRGLDEADQHAGCMRTWCSTSSMFNMSHPRWHQAWVKGLSITGGGLRWCVGRRRLAIEFSWPGPFAP